MTTQRDSTPLARARVMNQRDLLAAALDKAWGPFPQTQPLREERINGVADALLALGVRKLEPGDHVVNLATLASLFREKRWMIVDPDRMTARFGMPPPEEHWYDAIAAAIIAALNVAP